MAELSRRSPELLASISEQYPDKKVRSSYRHDTVPSFRALCSWSESQRLRVGLPAWAGRHPSFVSWSEAAICSSLDRFPTKREKREDTIFHTGSSTTLVRRVSLVRVQGWEQDSFTTHRGTVVTGAAPSDGRSWRRGHGHTSRRCRTSRTCSTTCCTPRRRTKPSTFIACAARISTSSRRVTRATTVRVSLFGLCPSHVLGGV